MRRLHSALRERGKETWVDWENIPFTAEWRAEIYAGIEGADAFLFVVSPNPLDHFPSRWREAHKNV